MKEKKQKLSDESEKMKKILDELFYQYIKDIVEDGSLPIDNNLGVVGKNALQSNLNTLKARKEKLAELSTSVNLNKPALLEERKKLFEEIQTLRTAIEKIRSKTH